MLTTVLTTFRTSETGSEVAGSCRDPSSNMGPIKRDKRLSEDQRAGCEKEGPGQNERCHTISG